MSMYSDYLDNIPATEESTLVQKLAWLLLEAMDSRGALTNRHELADLVGEENVPLAESVIEELKQN